jgi:UDP-N-acetyl-D-glucosamine dehydrogenase
MPDYVVRRLLLALIQRGRSVSGSGFWWSGSPTRRTPATHGRSPAIRVANLLLRMGADVRAADPLVTETASWTRR